MHISQVDKIAKLKQSRDCILAMQSGRYRLDATFRGLELTREFAQELHCAAQKAVDEFLRTYLERIDTQLAALGVDLS